MSLIVTQLISACLPPLQTPLKSKHDSPHLKVLSEISEKKAFSRLCFLLVLLKEECSVQWKGTSRCQLHLASFQHHWRYTGHCRSKVKTSGNSQKRRMLPTTEDCHTKYSSTDLCLHFLFSAPFSLRKSSVTFATLYCSQSKYYNPRQEVWMMLAMLDE